MIRRKSIVLLGLLAILSTGCDQRRTPEESILMADQQLRAGNAEGALAEVLTARVEYPESVGLLYQIGRAQQASATFLSTPGTQQDALRQLDAAAESFARVHEMNPQGLGRAARFNRATVYLQRDRFLTSADRYEERLQNLRHAVTLLADLVLDAPGFEAAQHNLDYARYHLSLLLQHPPRPSEEEEAGEEPSPANSAVDAATTQIPQATAEVIDGSTIILRVPGREEETP